MCSKHMCAQGKHCASENPYGNENNFIAKAFILLADIYVAQDNFFQAKATLESIIANHDDEELLNVARKKWELIIESEKETLAIGVEEESFIEISEDDFEYEVKQIDDDYIVPIPEVLIKEDDSVEEINKNILENEFE